MTIDLKTFTNEELTQLILDVADEQERRKQEGYISQQVSERVEPIADALVESSPEILENAPASTDSAPREWKPWYPLDPTTHFPPGCFVRHKGKLWKNMVEGKLNVWEPGAPGVYDFIWMEVPEPADPEPADPEPADPEPADPEPADPEPADPEPEVPADEVEEVPTEPEPEPEAPAEQGGVEEFVQPAGGHDAYGLGDKVRYNGKVYESMIDNNVWSPDTYAQGWKLVG